MQSFKHFLAESNNNCLYHGGRIGDLDSILLEGLKPITKHHIKRLTGQKDIPYDYGTDGPDWISGISTSRNKAFALSWAKKVSADGVVYEFSRSQILQNYKVIPHQFWYNRGTARETARRGQGGWYRDINEYEEFIVTNKPLDVTRYCTHIYVKQGSMYLNSYMERYLQNEFKNRLVWV